MRQAVVYPLVFPPNDCNSTENGTPFLGLTTTLLEGIARSEAKIARLQVYPIFIVHGRGVTTPQFLPFFWQRSYIKN